MKPAVLLAAVILSFGTASSALAACDDPAAPYVDWTQCSKDGANLSGVDLLRANLSEAKLFGANLFDAHLFDARVIEPDREPDLHVVNEAGGLDVVEHRHEAGLPQVDDAAAYFEPVVGPLAVGQ